MDNFQRVGAISNTHAGRDFQHSVMQFLENQGVPLEKEFALPIGCKVKKLHKFDLGSENAKTIVECKSYTWTSGGNSPSAKIRGLNEAMLHFSVAPDGYRKMLFLMKHLRREQSLGTHYVRSQGHLIGDDVEVWELDLEAETAERLI
jgi:hypothetical protein